MNKEDPKFTVYLEGANPFVQTNPLGSNRLLPGSDLRERRDYFLGYPEFATKINDQLQLLTRGDMLDVGSDKEYYLFLDLFFNSADKTLYSINLQDTRKSYPPHNLGMDHFDGDIALISNPKSVLKDMLFGSMLFWGSWSTQEATETNSMIENGMFHRFRRKSKVSAQKDKLLRACQERLSANGLLWIVSARYAFGGGGFGPSFTDQEIITYLDVARRGINLGVKNIYVWGQDRIKVARRIEETIAAGYFNPYLQVDRLQEEDLRRLAQRLHNPLTLASSLENSFLTSEDVSKALEIWEKLPEKDNLGLLDSVALEF